MKFRIALFVPYGTVRSHVLFYLLRHAVPVTKKIMVGYNVPTYTHIYLVIFDRG